MEMRDKEFDQLFNSKLNDFEVEPSAQVWQNINAELNSAKAKRSILPYISIAASIVVLVSVSLWLFNRSQEKAEYPVKLVKHIKQVKPQSTTVLDEAQSPIEMSTEDIKVAETAVVKVGLKAKSGAKKVQTVEQTRKKPTTIKPNLIAQQPEPVLAAAPLEKVPVLQPAVSISEVPLGPALLANHPVEDIKKDNDIAENNSANDKASVKKRARGLGGIINTIVAAVDKRDDKLIEFTDNDDDDGSRVTAVNLGIFKIKKQ
jgi:hypothetical protein